MKPVSDGKDVLTQVYGLLEEFNTKKAPLREDTTFATDLELDSLTVMDFVAAMEDHFDIIVPLNVLPDLETLGQVGDMIEKIVEEKRD